MAQDDITFSLKPVFIGWLAFVCQLPLQLFLTVWSAGFLGGISGAFLSGAHSRQAGLFDTAPAVFFGLLAFLGVPGVLVFGKKYNYARTEYKFYDDRLEFQEGFFTINRKVIKYKDIKEVTLRKGIVQRMYGLGTIYLATLATGSMGRTNLFEAVGFGNVSASGVGVRDISNPDDAYEKIKNLVDKYNV